MSDIINRALEIINDDLTIPQLGPNRRMAHGGEVLEDEYPTHYLPHVGRQVMAEGGMPIKGFEGRVIAPMTEPSNIDPKINSDDLHAAKERRAQSIAGNAWDVMSPEQRNQFMSVPEKNPLPDGEIMRMDQAHQMSFHGPWYHGSDRIDRVVENNKIDPRRATSGPMPFFTDSPELASGYAKGKSDTSLSKDDTGDVSQYFTVKAKDLGWRSKADIPVERAWNFLSPDVQKEIKSKALRVGYEDPYEASGDLKVHPEGVNGSIVNEDHYNYILKNEAQGNPLKALRILWHDSGTLFNEEHKLEDVFKLAGFPHEISQKNAPWTTAKGVLPAMLRIESPLVTNNVDELNEKVIPHLEQAFAKDRSRKKQFGADPWDKNTRYTPKEWVSQLKEDMAKGDNSYVWTSIPDKITDQLKALGYDGIIDTGGKGGGQEHRVAIPFYPHQVRSAFAKFNPEDKMSHDITKSSGGEIDNSISAYHGSPHEFEEFDPAFIGTGEGAQAYGHGLYFAGNEDVARSYRGSPELKYKRLSGHMSPVEESVYDKLISGSESHDTFNRLKKIGYSDDQLFDAIDKIYPQRGHMYEVRLDVHPEEHLLDWDKKLSEQNTIVKELFSKMDKSVDVNGTQHNPHEPYEDIGDWYKHHARHVDPVTITKRMMEAGIRGIRYKDAGSRGVDGGSGTHNYVIFDPKHIKVKRRYAKGGDVDGGITAYAIGNSIPHLEQASNMINTHDDIQLVPGVESIPSQEITSEKTSRNQIPALFKSPAFERVKGNRNLDYGGGAFDKGSEYLSQEHGIENHIYDPFNRDQSHNDVVLSGFKKKPADTATIANVLNVISEPEARLHVIKKVYDHIKPDGKAYFSVYEGDGKDKATGKGRMTRDGWQEYRHTNSYVDEIKKIFPDVKVSGKTIIASKKTAKAYGGAINPVELRDNNLEDEARRLILWSYAAAPLVRPLSLSRAEGGRTYPVAMTKEAKGLKKKKAKLKKMSPQEFLNETDPLHIGKGDRKVIDTFKHNIERGDHLGPLKIYNNGGQDGRHRANAAKELGVEKVPVIDYRKAGGGSVVNKAIGGGSFQGKKPPSIKNLARVKDKFIYHSGTVHDLQSMKDYLEPQHGDWIRELAEHSGYDDPDELLEKSTPLIWMSDKPTWVVSKVARKLNKPHDQVTVDDIREHGHVAVIPRKGDHADHVWRVGEEGLQNGPYSEVTNLNGEKTKAYNTDLFGHDKEPFGVERNEYISAQDVEPLFHLTGNDLVNFLRETGDLPKDNPNKGRTFTNGGSVLKRAFKVLSKFS